MTLLQSLRERQNMMGHLCETERRKMREAQIRAEMFDTGRMELGMLIDVEETRQAKEAT